MTTEQTQGQGERSEDAALLVMKIEEGSMHQGSALEAGEDKEVDSLLGPLEGVQPCRHLDFSPMNAISDF